jgi:hypothetical protein
MGIGISGWAVDVPGLIIRDRNTLVTIVDTTTFLAQFYGSVTAAAGSVGSIQLDAKETNQEYFYFTRPISDGFAASVYISSSGLLSWDFPVYGFEQPADTIIDFGVF